MQESKLVRIVPFAHNVDGKSAYLCNGTKVFVGDQEISGITGITIKLAANDLWRAVIECHIEPVEALVEAEFVTPADDTAL